MPPKPVFARVAAGSLWTLVLLTVAIALLFGLAAKSINTSGGWGWLMAAALIIALATFACAICAVASAISLYRREPHRGRSIVFLVACSLVVWGGKGIAVHIAGGLYELYQQTMTRHDARANGASRAISSARPPAATPLTKLDTELLDHFSRRGVVLKPATTDTERPAEWQLENVDAGKGCTVWTKFLRFPEGTSGADMRTHMMRINAASVLNEQAMLAMFYPSARHNVRDGNNCDAWGSKSGQITAALIDAFKSYKAPSAALAPVER